MTNYKVIQEYGLIRRKKDFPDIQDRFSEIYLEERAFNGLYDFVAENQEQGKAANQAFTLQKRRGKDCIRVKNYVGLIETKDGTGIEILPRLFRADLESSVLDIQKSRRQLLKMLKCLRDLKPIRIEEAHVKIFRFPLLEVFITAFLDELELLFKKGIQKDYILTEENSGFVKGRLLFNQQIKNNLCKAHRFAISYEQFVEDIPQNRLLKAALLKLQKASRSRKNQSRIIQNLERLYGVEASMLPEQDFQNTQTTNRLFKHYRTALSWSRVFLMNQAFTNFKGKHLNRALLFPMERVFEDYVSSIFKKVCTDDEVEVHVQAHQHFLIDQHLGQQQFRLRPDIVVLQQKNGSCITCHIIDTKWKIIDEQAQRNNYKIKQSDLYQLFAYGKKYQQHFGEATQVKLYLVYPKHPQFTEAIAPFYYDEKLSLKVCPFDGELDKEEVVNRILT